MLGRRVELKWSISDVGLMDYGTNRTGFLANCGHRAKLALMRIDIENPPLENTGLTPFEAMANLGDTLQ
jgi:hypothetical protein